MRSFHTTVLSATLFLVLIGQTYQQNQENERFLPVFNVVEPDVNLHNTDRVLIMSTNGTAQSLALHPRLSRSFLTNEGRKIQVFDNAIDFKLISSIHEYAQIVAEWEFQNLKDEKCGGPSPWYASLDAQVFEKSAVMSITKGLLRSVDVDQDLYKLYSVGVHVFRRGDRIGLTTDSDKEENDLSLLLYLNHYWRKNDYGELLFYEDGFDSITAISPKYNRVVIWDSSVGYIMKPPSMEFKQGMMCLKVKLTTNTTKARRAVQQRNLHIAEKLKAREDIFTDMKGSNVNTIKDVEKCMTKNFTSSRGKRVFIFDGLFNNKDLEKLKKFVPGHGQFYFDDSLDLESDNVQWIAGFDVDAYVQSPMWPVTQKVANFVSGTDQWFPYDISCNLLRTYDHTRIHEDCEKLENEWTFLVYLTRDWNENNYGETTFLEANKNDAEYITSVLPRFGRVVIFEGIIPHSARPPSPAFNDARLTFVAKLSINPMLARMKMFQIEFAHEEAMHQSCLGMFRHYHDETYEDLYRQQLLENAQELKEINDDIAKRFVIGLDLTRIDPEEDEEWDEQNLGRKQEGDGDDDEDDDDDDDDEELYPQYDEPSNIDEENFPEVKRRRNYIYGLFAKHARDAVALKEHYIQFLQDKANMKRQYIEQMEKLI